MRKCLVKRKIWVQPTTGSSAVPGHYEDLPIVEGFFHQFTEEDCDGERCCMAVVEFPDGIIETVPLYQVTLLPLEPIEGVVLTTEPYKVISDDFERRVIEIFEVGLHQFTMMCQNLSNRR